MFLYALNRYEAQIYEKSVKIKTPPSPARVQRAKEGGAVATENRAPPTKVGYDGPSCWRSPEHVTALRRKSAWISALRALQQAPGELLAGAGGRPGHPHDADFGVRVDQGRTDELVHDVLLV